MNNFLPELNLVFQVSEFNELIRNHLGLLGEVVIEGEISQIKIQKQLVFITIKDQSTSLDLFGISYQIPQVYSLEVGIMIQVSGSPSLYQKSSRFHVRAMSINPVGKGSLEKSYQLLKKRLEIEGLFDESRKRPLPKYPESVLLLTANQSQAFNDFVKVSRSRFPGIKITHLPVQVQGRNATKSIVNALNIVNRLPGFDAVVLTRGGGSIEDLAAFNDETVVRAVFECSLPIVCAIGHEGNLSLAELAADKRASTPTDAAVELVPTIQELNHIISTNLRFISTSVDAQINDQSNFLSKYINRIDSGIYRQSENINKTISKLSSLFLLNKNSYENDKKILFKKIKSLKIKFSHDFENLTQKYQAQLSLLNSLNPESVLQRGFSITKNQDGKIISDINQINLNQILTTQLANGKIRSLVKKKEPDVQTDK